MELMIDSIGTGYITLDKSRIYVYTYWQFCCLGIGSANNSIAPMVKSLDIGILVKYTYPTPYVFHTRWQRNSAISLNQAMVNIMAICMLAKQINTSRYIAITRTDTCALIDCGDTGIHEGIRYHIISTRHENTYIQGLYHWFNGVVDTA